MTKGAALMPAAEQRTKGQKQMGYGVWGMGYGVWGMKCKCECRWAGADWMSKLSKSAKPQYFIQGWLDTVQHCRRHSAFSLTKQFFNQAADKQRKGGTRYRLQYDILCAWN